MRGAREGDPITLVVEYDDADDLLADYAETLRHGGTRIETQRRPADGSEVRLVLSAAGLLSPIVVAGVARGHGHDDGVVQIEFEAADRDRLDATMARIRVRDPALVGHLARVLIAEDNPHLSNLICVGLVGSSKRAASHLQFNFQVAEDGRAALDLLEAHRFEIAIIDVYLPTMTGAQVIAAARAGRDPHMPIISLSAGGPAARELAMAAGADVFLDKPVQLRRLLDGMVALLAREGRA